MKSPAEIEALRKRVLGAAVNFGERHDLPFAGHTCDPRELHYFSLGALSFANAILELDRPDNLGSALSAMERENRRALERN